MIPSPLDTAALGPVHSTKVGANLGANSAIAPDLLAGTSPFPGLLEALQTGAEPPFRRESERELPSDAEIVAENSPVSQAGLLNFGAAEFTLPLVDRALGHFDTGKDRPVDGNMLPQEDQVVQEGQALQDVSPVSDVIGRIPGAAAASDTAMSSRPSALSSDPIALQPERTPVKVVTPPEVTATNGTVIARDVTHLRKAPPSPQAGSKPEVAEVSRVLVETGGAAKPASRADQAALGTEGSGVTPRKAPGADGQANAKDAPKLGERFQLPPVPLRNHNLAAIEAEAIPKTVKAESSAAELDAKLQSLVSQQGSLFQSSRITKKARSEKSASVTDAQPTSQKVILPDRAAADRIPTTRRGEGVRSEPLPQPRASSDNTAAPQASHSPSSDQAAKPVGTLQIAPLAPAASASASASAATVAPGAAFGIEARAETRSGQPIETIVNQITQARETARSVRPELTLRHSEFGAVNVRLEASGTDLRATLASRDPGFIPAIQAALGERMITAASESAAGQPGKGSDQGSSQSSANSSSHSSSQGQFGSSGGSADSRYGSSPGSGQGPSQPYSGQSEKNGSDGSSPDQSGLAGDGPNGSGSAGLFA